MISFFVFIVPFLNGALQYFHLDRSRVLGVRCQVKIFPFYLTGRKRWEFTVGAKKREKLRIPLFFLENSIRGFHFQNRYPLGEVDTHSKTSILSEEIV
ncbi:hypothetical protein LEP1GSC193_3035 [Leptospira alstonii serovar Pingchang str. 80-412]|uniref:Uncharacterized protein n=2 Tax=Leptospira alstonii TaxID=28452 RepID=M6CIK0_9LEPT|nr:hypothetical protein LEP1GSC194_4106 [Leptospira alstonii serovar Sichuan str. 79601]EQA79645.1 hypothetical protein LEP1GSC193_3035 [Leptospira alstonii serovar Pingchang str. 80-412]